MKIEYQNCSEIRLNENSFSNFSEMFRLPLLLTCLSFEMSQINVEVEFNKPPPPSPYTSKPKAG